MSPRSSFFWLPLGTTQCPLNLLNLPYRTGSSTAAAEQPGLSDRTSAPDARRLGLRSKPKAPGAKVDVSTKVLPMTTVVMMMTMMALLL